ncbi:MAG: type II CAAX endopeptidase family protein [Cyanobacteria bacterium J06641_5]
MGNIFLRQLRQLDRRAAPIRLGAFLCVLALGWVPVAAPMAWLLRQDANLTSIVTMAWLFVAFVLATFAWGHWVRQENLWWHYGVGFSRAHGRELLQGLVVGLLAALGLFAVQGLLGWQQSQPVTGAIARVAAEGLLSALGIGIAEELLFRGWILSECDRDYSRRVALWTNAVVFALLHFLKPLAAILQDAAQFPGLVLLGLALVWAKRRTHGRLGLAIGLHAGLVWGYYIVAVGNLLQPAPDVPVWLTGVHGNPVASVLGWLGLGAIALWVRRQSPRGDA